MEEGKCEIDSSESWNKVGCFGLLLPVESAVIVKFAPPLFVLQAIKTYAPVWRERVMLLLLYVITYLSCSYARGKGPSHYN